MPSDIVIAHAPEQTRMPPLITGQALGDYASYFVDESRTAGYADAIAFPKNTLETAALLRYAAERGMPVTISGARTGITGGAAPRGGLVVALERMNRIVGLRRLPDGEIGVECEAGLPLADLQRAVRRAVFPDASGWSEEARGLIGEVRERRLFYPPDPTETSASIGGTIACNASGAHTFRYGPTRPYVHALEVVLADGSILELERGRERTTGGRTFRIRRPDGTVTTVKLPDIDPPRTKNAAGYYSKPGMDVLDLFIGSEGTLGVITRAVLRLIPAPGVRCHVATFWPGEQAAVEFTIAAREQRENLCLEAIEYMDPNAVRFLRERRRRIGAASQVPECLPDDARAIVFLDLGTEEPAFEGVLDRLVRLVRDRHGNPDTAWTAVSQAERERIRAFRHALPEAVNTRISEIRREFPKVTKLGTDMAVPDEALRDLIGMYRDTLDRHRLEYVMFGHIGDNHLHVNILPRNEREYELGWRMYHDIAAEVVRLGGSPAAEHGIGKLKRDFLTLLYGPEGVEQMKRVKETLDPKWILGKGTLFE